MNHATITTTDALHAARRTMEEGAAEQYDDIAESFAAANNEETAAIFRDLAEWERGNRGTAPDGPVLAGFNWYAIDPGDPDALHYLMRPYHALKLAMANERRAKAFFEGIAAGDAGADVQALARDLAAREQDHLDQLRAWRDRLPAPEEGWDDDLDPPRFDME